MTQKQHVIHGRDHGPNGADPIPNIGGAVDWEDVGGTTPGGGGIQFDQDNDGSWFNLETSGTRPDYNDAITIFDNHSPPLSSIVLIGSAHGFLQLSAPKINIGPNVLNVEAPNAGFDVSTLAIGIGSLFRILVGGLPVLEVRADGTFHIKSGAAWVADL